MSESGCGGLLMLGLLGLAVYSCSGNSHKSSSSSEGRYGLSSGYSESSYEEDEEDKEDEEEEEALEEREPFDEDAARQQAESDMEDSSYVSEGSTYGCTEDCSGHEAGWRWRADTGAQGYNPDSPSFEEGGRAFDDAVDEKVEEMRDAYEREEDQ